MSNPHSAIFVMDPEEPALTDLQKAEIEVTTVMTDARSEILEHQMLARELRARATHLTERAAALIKAIGGELRPLAIGLGVAGLIVWPAAYILEEFLFQALLHSTLTSVVLAAVFAATFVGVGNQLLDHTTLVPSLRGSTPPQRLIAGALLVLLLSAGLALSLALGPARAQELLGATIRTDRATLQNLRITGADPQTLDVAAATLAADEATLEMDAKVSTITVLVLVASEITLGGFALDVIGHIHQKTLTRSARRAAEDARGEDDAATQVPVDVRARLAAIGPKHGISRDDIDRMTLAELQAHAKLRDRWSNNGNGRAPGQDAINPGQQTTETTTATGPTQPGCIDPPDVNDPPMNPEDPPETRPRPPGPGGAPVEDTGEIF